MITSKVSAILAALAIATISLSANAEERLIKKIVPAYSMLAKTMHCPAKTDCTVVIKAPEAVKCQDELCVYRVSNKTNQVMTYSIMANNTSDHDVIANIVLAHEDNRSRDELLEDLLKGAQR